MDPDHANGTLDVQFGHYCLLGLASRGTSGIVYAAEDLRSKEIVAIKLLSKSNILRKPTGLSRLRFEIRALSLLDHPNIVRLVGVVETLPYVGLVMEYVSGGELFDYIVAQGSLQEDEARRIFKQITAAIAHCHANHIVHRDLKPENILLDSKGNVKVIDFGLSDTFRPDVLMTTFCGSPSYAAPEIFVGSGYVGPEVDVWSMGGILYTMLVGRLPFRAPDLRALCTRILECKLKLPKRLSPESRDLLRQMLTVDRSRRITLDRVVSHPWSETTGRCAVTLLEDPGRLPPN